ncbi:MAG TPA: alpha-2-macroglobulin family protein, partial [Chthonomonadaceae bacterium]|nr:alpha-2-macroglobulin family protein [Chthonomonadaceae bacterium]
MSLSLLSCISLCLCASSVAGGSTLSDADKHFAQKSYAAALKEYQAAQKAGQVPDARKDEVAYRIAVSLGKSEQWDRALEASLAFVQAHRGTVWEARGLYWMGRLYLAVPHEGWRVGKTITRGANVPQSATDEKPEQLYLQVQDARNCIDALEAARVLFDKLPHAADTRSEEIQLNFDLAHVLAEDGRLSKWMAEKVWQPPADPMWKLDASATYSPDWPIIKRIFHLYAQSVALAPGAHSAALARFGSALMLNRYQHEMRNYAIRWEEKKYVPIPFPYQGEDPVEALRRLVRDFPNDPIRDQAQFTLAVFLEQDGKYTLAEKELRRLIAERPKSRWVSDAHAYLQGLGAHCLALQVAGTQIVGKPAQFGITARNVKRVHFAVYPVHLAEAIGQGKALHDPDRELTAFPFAKLTDLRRQFGAPLAEWDRTMGDKGDYQPTNATLTLPVTKPGAYVVVASAPGVRTAALVTYTDLILVEKMDREGALFFATDAHSGAPVAGAQLLVKQIYSEKDKSHVAIVRAMTNAEGLATVPWPYQTGRSNFQIAALAWKAERCALTDRSYWNDYDNSVGHFKVYATTDRAVYRPLQTVHYREAVLERKGGAFQPAAGRQFHVEVFDPNGKRIYAALTRSNAFGSVNGQFNLPSDAPLGEYNLQCAVWQAADASGDTGGNAFRVEEYKKPEYVVTVTPEAERVRLGQPTGVKVSAKYYFGGPVPNAKVTYRVYRNGYSQSYRFPRAYDFLYNPNASDDFAAFHNGEVVAQGTARTDAVGEAKVTFPTQADNIRWKDIDLTYTVEADVQDASRRTITGTGTVKATKHDVAVFLDFPHGYATKGDRVDVEIMTLNPSDQPISVEGVAKVYRQPDTEKGKPVEVFSQPLLTDTHGRAILHWNALQAGYYQVAFVTRDTAGEEVRGETDLWVDGQALTRGRFHYRGIYLGVENLYYEEGQTAKVLLVTQEPDCTVLLTREAGNEILEKRLVHIPGRSLTLSIPLTHRDVPNVFLSAILVRHGELLQATQELFVPPVRQLATVEVKADKAQYHPGEKATFRLQAHDWQGRPLRTELAVSVSDAALSYIQKNYAPDIRLYYYGDRRSIGTEENGSTDISFDGWDEDTQTYRIYVDHPLLQPDGMGQIPNWPRKDLYGNYYSQVDALYPFQPMWHAPLRNSGRGEHSVSALARPSIGSIPRSMSMRSGEGGGMIEYSPAHSRRGRSLSGDTAQWLVDINGLPPDPTTNIIREGWGIDHYESSGRADRRWIPLSQRLLDEGIGLEAPILRSKFVDTAFWTPAVMTDTQGNATVEVTWPDNLTQWNAHAVGNTASAQVGTGEAQVTTKKDLIVRLQAPRYFVEKDVMVLSANVHNYTGEVARVKVQLDLGNDCLEVVPTPSLLVAGIHGVETPVYAYEAHLRGLKKPLSQNGGGVWGGGQSA